MVFLWSRHWRFCASRERGLPSSVRRRRSFFLGENLRAAKKNGKNAIRGRDGQAKGPRRRFHARMTGWPCDGFKPTRCRLAGRVPARASVAAPAAQNVNDGRNPDFARGAMRRLCGTDGNPVQTTAPPTAPAALATTTCTCLPALATAARQDERRRQRVAVIHKLLRRASARYPRSAGQRTVRWARRTSRPDDGAGGLVWCTKGNRPLSPYPRASLTTSRQ